MVQSFAFMGRFVDLLRPGEAIQYQLQAMPLGNRHLVSLDDRLSFDPEFREPCGSPRFFHQDKLAVEELMTNWQNECASVMYRFFELFPDYDITEKELRRWVDRFSGKEPRR